MLSAGRGRLADGERRLTGKPRDPPGVMPPRENNREPGAKAQLPEGWNRPREEWKSGKAFETQQFTLGSALQTTQMTREMHQQQRLKTISSI